MSDLPVVVIGAGPQGLAAAAHLLERGLDPLVLEAGDGPAQAVSAWGHVRLFSAWPELVDAAVAEDGRSLPAADQVIVLTGFRPDLSFLSEMRLELDATLQAPVKVAVEVDPNVHSCGDVDATGAADLAHPEPDLYLIGMKSYGRAPTFLAMTGYEQVRSVAAELAGDHEAAARVDLVLPDTGVCTGAGLFDDPDGASAGGCCAAPPALVEIGAAPARA